MKLMCKQCGAPIAAGRINVQTMTAVCDACDAVFPFDHADLIGADAKRHKLTQPDGIDVLEDADQLTIRLQWRKLMGATEWIITLIFMFVALILTGVLLGFIGSDLASLTPILGLVAAFLGYLVGLVFLNRLEIEVDDEQVRSRHRPLPWFNHTVNRDDISEIVMQPASMDDPTGYQKLNIVRHDSTHVTLDTSQQYVTAYVKQRLEQALFAPAVEPDPFYDETALGISDDGELLFEVDDDSSVKRRRG